MGTLLKQTPDRPESTHLHLQFTMNAATLVAVLFFAAYTSATTHTPLTEPEIRAWFNLVDTDDDQKVTTAELDTAHGVFGAKCSLTKKITADGFFNDGDLDRNDYLSEQELSEDFHKYGELVDGEVQSYFEILDSNNDNQVSRQEMRAGVSIMEDQCETLRDISAESFSKKNCFDGEAGFEEFSTCLHLIENEK